MSLHLNCDLGESYGNWTMGMDAAVMPFIDQANIACGFHAGDPVVLSRTLNLAKMHNVIVGAHPAYPDKEGFGRRSIKCSGEEIIALMHYQIAAIDGMASSAGLTLQYVKPHGALYNDMMAQTQIFESVLEAVSSYHRSIDLMLLATPDAEQYRQLAKKAGVNLLFEAFADRCYGDDGRLLARTHPRAVHQRDKMLAQVDQLCKNNTITTIGGKTISLKVDTICVHGDNRESVEAIELIRQLMRNQD